MRILLSSHGASLFGAERVLIALAHGLAARGHDVTLELPHEGPAHDTARQIAGVRVVLSGRVRLPRNAAELLRFAAGLPAARRTVRDLLDAGAYDAVWINSIYNLPGALAGAAARVPVIWHLHERNFGGAAGAVARRVVRACSTVAVAPSGFVATSFQGAGGPSFVRVLPNAPLRSLEPLPLPEPHATHVHVGYLGQLEPRKRAADVVHALALLPAGTAVLVGEGKARHALEAAIARTGLGGRVRLAGFQQDIRAALHECSCVVIPSRDEPFGLVALEAMALGLPVIAARSGALPDVLGNAALYYPVGDQAALAESLRRLHDEPRLRTTLRQRGLERVRAFTLDGMLDGAETLLREAADGSPAEVAW